MVWTRFTGSRSRPIGVTPRRARLFLETLERRECLSSGWLLPPAADPSNFSAAVVAKPGGVADTSSPGQIPAPEVHPGAGTPSALKHAPVVETGLGPDASPLAGAVPLGSPGPAGSGSHGQGKNDMDLPP